jgi:hypothetical protein
MLKRKRRTTVCKVEQLEGRVVPSAMAAKAVVIGNSSTTLELHGYTTLPTAPGEHLELSVVQLRDHVPLHKARIVGRTAIVVVHPTSHPGDSGSFSATIHVANAADRFHPDGEIELDAGLLSGRRVVERFFSQVKVSRD